MIPVYVCDDEPAVSARIRKLVADQIMMMNGDMGPVEVVGTPEELLEKQRLASVPAIYFLDIDFPGSMSGLTLAQKLRQYDPRGFLVFITGHDDLAFETFRLRLEAMDYIVKGEEAPMAVRIRECLESITERLGSERPGQGAYCTVKMFDTVRHIPLSEILYFEAMGFKHTLQLHMDGELLEFNSSLDHFAKQLGEEFWRCHRSFLVNRSRIRSVQLAEQLVELDDGSTCPLSRKAKTEYNASQKGKK